MYSALLLAGIILVFLGLVFVLAYILLSAVHLQKSTATNQSLKVGGVVMIGPIPIVFGNSGRTILLAEIFAIVLIILAIVFFLLARH
jgi:Protein of unknown function DUF131.